MQCDSSKHEKSYSNDFQQLNVIPDNEFKRIITQVFKEIEEATYKLINEFQENKNSKMK